MGRDEEEAKDPDRAEQKTERENRAKQSTTEGRIEPGKGRTLVLFLEPLQSGTSVGPRFLSSPTF